jgi:hypothetical protein
MLFKIPFRAYLYPIVLLIYMNREPAIYWWLGFMVFYIVGIYYNYKKGEYDNEKPDLVFQRCKAFILQAFTKSK